MVPIDLPSPIKLTALLKSLKEPANTALLQLEIPQHILSNFGSDEKIALIFPRSVQNRLSVISNHRSQEVYGIEASSVFYFSKEDFLENPTLTIVSDFGRLPWFGPAEVSPHLTKVGSVHELQTISSKALAAGGLTQQLFVGVPLIIAGISLVLDSSISFFYLSLFCSALAVRSVALILYGSNLIPQNSLVDVFFILIHAMCFLFQAIFSLSMLKLKKKYIYRNHILVAASTILVVVIFLRVEFWAYIDSWMDVVSSSFSLLCSLTFILLERNSSGSKVKNLYVHEENFFNLDKMLLYIRNSIIFSVFLFHIQVNIEDIVSVTQGSFKSPLDWRHWAFLPGMLLAALVEIGSVAQKIDSTAKQLTQKALMEKDLAVGKDFQQRLLPTFSSSFKNFKWRAFYKPASSLAGDWFDIREITLSNQKKVMCCIVADVTGHGTGPALCTAIIASSWHLWCLNLAKNQLEAEHFRFDVLLSQAATSIHESLLLGRLQGTGTAAMMVVDCESHDAFYITAGHPSILLNHESSIRALGTLGTMLGLPVENPQWECKSAKIQPGEFIFLYSDGCWPPQDPHSLWIQRMKRAYKKETGSLALKLLNQMRKTRAFYREDRESEDDMTLLMIQMN